MALTTKRIIALPSQNDPQEGDYLAIDNATSGTHKMPVGRIGVEVDDTLTEQGKAADAKAVGDALGEIRSQAEATDDAIDEIRSQIEVTGTASGAIATFTDGSAMPAKSVIVNIEPQQSGTGTPSPDNVRPISGWESVSVDVSGKNLLKIDTVNAIGRGITQTLNEDGTITLSGTSASAFNGQAINGSAKFILPAGTYRFVDVGQTSGATFYYYLRAQGNSAWIQSGQTFTVPEGSSGCWIVLYFPTNTEVSGTHGLMIVSENSTYDTYESHIGTTTTTSLGRTVYGGTLDVVSGALTVDRAMVDLGTLDFDTLSSPDRHVFRASTITNMYDPPTDVATTAICEEFSAMAYAPISASDNGRFAIGTGRMVFIDHRFSDVASFEQAIQGVKLVYPLATPQTYTLTGQEVETLLGDNNVWADSGDVEVVYVRDLNIAINNLLNNNGTRSLGMMAMSAPTDEQTEEEPTDEQSDEQSDEDMR